MSQQTSPTKRERRESARAERLDRERAAASAAARKRRLTQLGGLVLVAAAIIVAAILISSGGDKKSTAGSGGKLAGASATTQLFAGIPQNGVTLGRPDAPVTLVEFADPQCPFCKQYSLEQMPAVIQKYVRTGKLKMELRLLTFLGPDSVTAGHALAATALQNKLWQSADLFYRNQGEENSGYVTDSFLKRVLGGVDGLNVDRALSTDIASSKVTDQLGEAKTLQSRYGVNSTPTVLIGPSGGSLKKDSEQAPTADGIGKQVEAILAQAK